MERELALEASVASFIHFALSVAVSGALLFVSALLMLVAYAGEYRQPLEVMLAAPIVTLVFSAIFLWNLGFLWLTTRTYYRKRTQNASS